VRTKAGDEAQLSALISGLLEKHECYGHLRQVMADLTAELSSYGFMLRALPPKFLSFEDDSAEAEGIFSYFEGRLVTDFARNSRGA